MTDRTTSASLADPHRLTAVSHALDADEAARTSFERVASLAARSLGTPVAQVNFITAERQISVTSRGPDPWNGPREVALESSFCQHVVVSGDPLMVGDARAHPVLRGNPATEGSGVVAYAAVPLRVAGDLVVGTLCVVDFSPRDWSPEDIELLRSLGDFVVGEIERRGHSSASLSHLTAVLESGQDAIIGADLDGRILSWSPGAERMFGFAAAEVLGRSVYFFAPPHCHDEIVGVLRQVRKGRSTPRYDTERIRRDGVPLSVSVIVTPVHDLAGRVTGATALLRDITSRMQALQALQESEDRFRQLAQSVDAVFWLRDLMSREILYVSPAYERIWGRPRSTLRENSEAWLDAVHPADRDRVVEMMKRSGDREYDVEYRIGRPDGTEAWVRDRGFPVRDQQGEIIRMAGLVEDVTEIKRSREALTERDARYRALIEHSAEIISVLAADGSIEYESPAMERVLGYTPEELMGRSVFDLIHELDRPGAAASLADVLRGSAEVSVELRARHKDGTYRVIAATAANLLDEPSVRGIVVNSRDITQLRAGEERLRASQRMEAVGRLAGGIAHDFNNVLMVVKGSARLALMDLPPDSPVRGDVEEIADAADRAARLTRQLLAFSRQQVLQPQILNLNDIVADMETMLRRTLGQNVDLVTSLDPRLGRVEVDPGQMEQILMNLAVNARDAMPDGGRLVMETRNADLSGDYAKQFGFSVEPGPYAMISVVDSGIGIPADVRERIFEPFFTTKPRDKGNGLGLATVYGIVKQSEGYIWVYSEEGRGTTFKIYLPRVDGASGPAADEDTSPRPRRNPVILLVEDDPVVRSIGRRMLERMHYSVMEADDGDDAIVMAEELGGDFEVLLTDVMMPRMGGKELADRITSRWPHVRVLYTSGYADEAVLKAAALHGHISFLHKPYEPSELNAALRELLGGDAGEA